MHEPADHADQFAGQRQVFELADFALAGGNQEIQSGIHGGQVFLLFSKGGFFGVRCAGTGSGHGAHHRYIRWPASSHQSGA